MNPTAKSSKRFHLNKNFNVADQFVTLLVLEIKLDELRCGDTIHLHMCAYHFQTNALYDIYFSITEFLLAHSDETQFITLNNLPHHIKDYNTNIYYKVGCLSRLVLINTQNYYY